MLVPSPDVYYYCTCIISNFQKYFPKQQLFWHLLHSPKKQDHESNLLFIYFSDISLTCCDLLMQLFRKLEKRSQVVLLPALGHVPGCLTKNSLFTVMALDLFSLSFLSENSLSLKTWTTCIFWWRIMQNNLQQMLDLCQIIIFLLLFLSSFIPHMHHELQRWKMTFLWQLSLEDTILIEKKLCLSNVTVLICWKTVWWIQTVATWDLMKSLSGENLHNLQLIGHVKVISNDCTFLSCHFRSLMSKSVPGIQEFRD